MAPGTVQFTKAENLPLSAYATSGPVGQDEPNDGGSISEIHTIVIIIVNSSFKRDLTLRPTVLLAAGEFSVFLWCHFRLRLN